MAEAALKQDPANREANRILGSVYAALAEQRQSSSPATIPRSTCRERLRALERARQDGGADLGLELTLGRLYLQTKAFDKAIPLLRRVSQQQPGYAEVAVLLATAEERAGRTADALATLRRVLDENPKSLRGLGAAGRAEREAGASGTRRRTPTAAPRRSTRGVDLEHPPGRRADQRRQGAGRPRSA